MDKLILAVGYNAVWAAAVLGGARGSSWPGLLAAAALLAWIGLRRGGADRRWLLLLLAAGAYGTLADGLLTQLGGLSFPGEPDAWPLPAWMPALWIAFTGLLGPLFGFLAGRAWLSVVLGAVAGPVTYAGAAKFGGAEFGGGWWPVAWVAAEWALFLPIAVRVATAVQRAAPRRS